MKLRKVGLGAPCEECVLGYVVTKLLSLEGSGRLERFNILKLYSRNGIKKVTVLV